MPPIDLQKLADEAKFNRFHALILFWCALFIVFDGYDLAVAGVAMPAIMKDMGVSPTQAGFMASSALFGMSFGAIFLGTLSDRIGRRGVIVMCLLLFSVFTAAAGLADDPLIFGAMRFLAGLGIGGVMPNVIAEMSEYAPRRMRATLITLMMCGYAVGGILAAWLGKAMIAQHGWQAVFYAGLAPVVLIPFILRSLPESMPYLLSRGRQDALRAIAARLDPSNPPGPSATFALSDSGTPDTAPVRHLFADGRSMGTLMLWTTYFMCLFMVYALSTWLTKLMASAGHSLGSAMTFVMVLNLGSIIGALGGGWLADRFQIKHVLVVMCLLAFASISLLGQPLPEALLYVVVGLAGATTIGTQTVTHACTGQFYPMTIRATGLGWALGIGRIGAIIAPILIGILVSLSLPLEMNFIAIAIPALIAAVAIARVDTHPAPQGRLARV